MSDLVQIGWRWKDEPQTWCVRALMRTDPAPAEGWEPVYVLREADPEYIGYWKRVKDLEAEIKRLTENA